jgi:hypothetical protein
VTAKAEERPLAASAVTVSKVSLAARRQLPLTGGSICNHPQNFHYLKAALRDVPLPTHCSRWDIRKADLQRGAKGLRALAQSRLSAGLGGITTRILFSVLASKSYPPQYAALV